MAYRSYVYISLILIFSLLMITAGINIAVDPFNGFQSPHIKNWNDNKIEASKWPFITQTLAIRNIRPDTLILGTSRTSVGIDPGHSAIKNDNPYNFAIFGLNLSQVGKLFDFSQTIHPSRRIIIGLDFFAFNKYAPGRTDFDESFLLAGKGWQTSLANNIVKAKLILSWQTLKSSFNTLRVKSNHQEFVWKAEDLGQTNPSQMETLMIERKTQHNAFIASESSYIRSMYFPWPYKKFDLGLQEKNAPIKALRHIIHDAYARGIDVHLFISPVHARQLEVIKRVGLWETFEYWKRTLTILIEEEAKLAGKKTYPLWDFSGYNSITIEPLPPKDNKEARMRWYWESSHYRSETGDLVLNGMLGSDKPSTNAYQDFGTLINTDNIESHLNKIRIAHDVYARSHSNDVIEVAGLVGTIDSKLDNQKDGKKLPGPIR